MSSTMCDAAESPGVIRVAGFTKQSITDGPGLRLVVFAQGCGHRCPGCHNPQTWDAAGGYNITIGEILAMYDENPLLDGITLSGGEPFLQAGRMISLAREIIKRGGSVVAFTGWLFEELQNGGEMHELAELCDIIIDGPYIEAERTIEMRFRGSRNQRMIDVKQSLTMGETIEIE